MVNDPITKGNLLELLNLENYFYAYLYIKVYPQCIFKNKSPDIKFSLVEWQTDPFSPFDKRKQTTGIFILRGIWQFLYHNYPVLSIYKNKNSNNKQKITAIHLPIKMKRDDCQPFSDRKTNRKKYFISGYFRFIPDKNAFGWIDDIYKPTVNIPTVC